VAEERMKSYRQLEKRIAREKQLMVAQQKMELKKMLRV
jgi:U3 small nucleolar RNA-associated protein 11